MTSPAAPQDPAGLLTRLPELRMLCSDARVARAVASGDSFKVYRTLRWGRLTGRLGAHRATLDRLLRSRRVFARPLDGKSPALGTIRGFGATFVGHSELEPDGTYITTHAVVLLFVLPVWPLGAYLVRGLGDSGYETSWRIFARVPLGAVSWAWTRLLAVGAAAAVLAAGWAGFHGARHHDLHVVNGFAQPVEVTVGPRSFAVPPGGHEVVNLPVGRHEALARAGGVLVDDGPIEVMTGSDVQVWNVAGAAPVMERDVIYSAEHGPAAPREPDPVLHCGERRVSLQYVDYAFTEAPRQLPFSRGQTQVVKRAVGVAEQQGADGALVCGVVLWNQKAWPGALAVLERRARAAGWEADAARQAVWAAAPLGLREQVRVARVARDAHPDDVPLVRLYQDLASETEDAAAMREEYRRRAEAAPDSPDAQYLHGRLLRGDAALAFAEAQLRRFPEHLHLLRLVTGVRADRADWDGVDRSWRVLRARSAVSAGEVLDTETWALVSRGRHADALQAIEDVFPHLRPAARSEAAVLYARVAARSGKADPGRLIARLDQAEQPLARAQAGLDPGKAEPSPALLILRTAARDPKEALTLIAEAGPTVVWALDGDTALLLYGEAVRTGHPALKVLETATRGARQYLDAFERFVRGETNIAVTPQMRAAAELVRSRVRTLPAAERNALRAAALKDDVLGTAVSRAVAAWPEPER